MIKKQHKYSSKKIISEINPLAPISLTSTQDLSIDDLFATEHGNGRGLIDMTHFTADPRHSQPLLKSNQLALESRRHKSPHLSDTYSFSLEFDHQIDWTAFGLWLSMLLNRHGRNILRVKGLLNIAGFAAPIAIHGVQHVVHPPIHLPKWPNGNKRSRLVFITRELDQRTIEKSFSIIVNDLQV